MNKLIEGDCLEVMKSIFDPIDFMLWDPPYNTGNKKFIYNDKFYTSKKDRHSKWLSFMEVRLELAKKLLKDTGVIAVHIGYQELFRLGLLMDEIFGEDNRLGIINWECTYGPKNIKKGISSTTDYILVYAKNKELSYRGAVPRTTSMNDRYKNPDNDPRGPWIADNLTVGMNALMRPNQAYDLKDPKTGKIYKHNPNRVWTYIPSTMSRMIEEGRIIFPSDAKKRPMLKRYLYELKHEGRSIGTYWKPEDFDIQETDSLGIPHQISGNNGDAKKLIKSILGDNCPFDTPKPLKLTERLVQMFCPKDGIVLDAFGGSATTAHAVLSLNAQDAESKRTFILIEQDAYIMHNITKKRIDAVISGKWATKDIHPLGGNYVLEYLQN